MYIRKKNTIFVFLTKYKSLVLMLKINYCTKVHYTNFQRAHNGFQTAEGCKEELYGHDLVTTLYFTSETTLLSSETQQRQERVIQSLSTTSGFEPRTSWLRVYAPLTS